MWPEAEAELGEAADDYESRRPALGKIALLLALLQPLHAFDDRVPPVHEREHETIHLKVPRPAVVNGRLVAEGEVHVVVDLISERESEAEVVELFP